MLTTQQEAAQMFAAEQAAEVITLDNLAEHNVPAGLIFSADMDDLLKVSKDQYASGEFKQSKKTALSLIEEAGRQKDKRMLVQGQYHVIRASAELNQLNNAQFERIFVHKDQLGDKSNLDELYYHLAGMKFKKKDKLAGFEALKKAEKHLAKGSKWADDILMLRSEQTGNIDEQVSLYKKIMLQHPDDGKGDLVEQGKKRDNLLARYAKLSSKEDMKFVSDPSSFALKSCKSLKSIAEKSLRGDTELADNIADWFIKHAYEAPLLNENQLKWAKQIKSQVKGQKESDRADRKRRKERDKKYRLQEWEAAYENLPWYQDYMGLASLHVSNIGPTIKLLDIGHGRFNRHSSILGGGIDYSFNSAFRGELFCADFIGHYKARHWKVEPGVECLVQETIPSFKGHKMIYLSKILNVKGRAKFLKSFYFEAGAGGQTLEPWIQVEYDISPEGIMTFQDKSDDNEFTRQVIDQFTTHYNIQTLTEKTNQFDLNGDDMSVMYEVGAGIHNIILNPGAGMMVDYAGLLFQSYQWGTDFWTKAPNDLSSDGMWVKGPFMKTKELWFNGEMSLIQNKKWNIGVLAEHRLYDNTEIDGVPVLKELYKTAQPKGNYGIDIQLILKNKPHKHNLILQGTAMINLDSNDKTHPVFGVGLVWDAHAY